MKYFTTTGKASRRAIDCVIVGVYNRGKLGVGATDIDAASKGQIKNLIKSGDIGSQVGRWTVLTNLDGVKADRVVVVGLGDAGKLNATAYKKAVAGAIRAVNGTRTRQILNTLSLETVADGSTYYKIRHAVEAIGDALYRYDQTKSGRKKKPLPLTAIGHSIAKRGQAAQAAGGADHGDAIANGVAVAKNLGNLPSNICTPS